MWHINLCPSTIKQISGKQGLDAWLEKGISVGQVLRCIGRQAWARSLRSAATSSEGWLIQEDSTTTAVTFTHPCLPTSAKKWWVN